MCCLPKSSAACPPVEKTGVNSPRAILRTICMFTAEDGLFVLIVNAGVEAFYRRRQKGSLTVVNRSDNCGLRYCAVGKELLH